MGTDFRNSRGLNLSDPKYDKDAVNLRTLKREVQNIVVGTGTTTVGLFEEGSGNNSIVSKDSGSNAGGDYSIVLGGLNNNVATNADYSAIVGGVGNDVLNGVQNSVVVGGINVNASQNNSLYTQNARLAENNGIIYSAGTNLYNIFAPAGTVGGADIFTNSLSYDNSNKITLTKSDASTLDIVIDEFSGLTINGDLEVSGVLTSGSTDLYDIFSTDGAALNSLNQGRVFVGNLSNTPQGVDLTGDILINYSGNTTIQPDSVTFDKMQDLDGRSVIGTVTQSGGTVEEIPMLESYTLSASTITLLDNSSNWNSSGVYVGTTISGTYQGQAYYNAGYWFTAVDDDVWIRMARS
tara:strand:- start:1135 stop:2187 length:1053 start_codon:yes stop_codon:yes gene_type:complete